MEREARGILDADKPRSEYMQYWAPSSYKDSALKSPAAFAASVKLPFGTRCAMEREARGM